MYILFDSDLKNEILKQDACEVHELDEAEK
jgi:hypothetical protein